MTVCKPILPKDLNARKKMNSSSCSDWINIIELVGEKYTDNYIAYPINILNGYFKIFSRKVTYEIYNGQEQKKHSSLCESYVICFDTDAESEKYKSYFYDSFKEKLGVDFFLPDWINIVDFIHNIKINMTSSNSLDVETVMAAVSTIDTAEQISTTMPRCRRKVTSA